MSLSGSALAQRAILRTKHLPSQQEPRVNEEEESTADTQKLVEQLTEVQQTAPGTLWDMNWVPSTSGKELTTLTLIDVPQQEKLLCLLCLGTPIVNILCCISILDLVYSSYQNRQQNKKAKTVCENRKTFQVRWQESFTLKMVFSSSCWGLCRVACFQGIWKRLESLCSQMSPGYSPLSTWATSQGFSRTLRGWRAMIWVGGKRGKMGRAELGQSLGTFPSHCSRMIELQFHQITAKKLNMGINRARWGRKEVKSFF